MTPTARRVVVVMAALVAVSWGLFFAFVLPGDYRAGTTTFGVGMAVTAFVLGMRHAFDADHIAAIDNTSRKLIGEHRDSSSVGLWFALGHSTVVLLAIGLVAGGFGALTSQIGDDESPFAAFTSIWGPLVSSTFLLVVAAQNLSILVGLRRGRGTSQGETSQGETSQGETSQGETSQGEGSAPRGLVWRVLGRGRVSLDAPWKMLIVGLLFGLGFDTASTIALLLIAGGAGIVMPWYAAMVLPLLFTAGMVLGDGLNSITMARMYAWSVDRPDRRRRYNITLTALSVAIALFVGLHGLSGVLVDTAGGSWTPVRELAAVDLEYFGLVIVGLLLTAALIGWSVSRTADGARR